MGFWPYRKYVEYVERHARGGDFVELHYPYSEDLDADNPKIVLGYFSMPLWMDTFDVSFDEGDVTFRRILHAYRAAAKDYAKSVRDQFNALRMLRTGQALMKEIHDTGKWLRVLPNWQWLEAPNAYAVVDGSIIGEPGGGGIEQWKAATARGAPMADGKGWVIRDDSGRPMVGNGDGANSLIWYTPGMWDGKRRPTGPAHQPDEVLYHELVHASREMRGVRTDFLVNKGYDNLEEYLAVVLTNIYLSEKGQTVFAGNHGGSVTLQGEDADNFLHNAQNVDVRPTMLIQNLKDYQPEFYRALASLPPWRPKYNWVRQYDEESRALERQNRNPA
jgi:hypothetical protein